MANEVIVFKDSVAAACTWLDGDLGTGVGISGKVPKDRPAQFVKVTLTGNHRVDLAYREAQLTFECWAPSDSEASDLAELAYARMFAVAGETINGSHVRKVVHIGGPSNFEDPQSQSSRYQFTIGVQYRGYAAA